MAEHDNQNSSPRSDEPPSLETERVPHYPTAQPEGENADSQPARSKTVIKETPIEAENKFNLVNNASESLSQQSLVLRGRENETNSSTDSPENEPIPQASEKDDSDVKTQTIIGALIALVSSFREEIRSQRGLLVSNIVLLSSILLSALSNQIVSALKIYFWLGVPHPAAEVFLLWIIGMLFMVKGLFSTLPSRERGAEGMAGLRAKQAAEKLAERDTDKAIQKLKDAVLEEYDRLKVLDKSRKPFGVAFTVFVLCLVLEFFAIMFLA